MSNISVHISILGTCVMRDVFRVMDRQGRYVVDRYVQTVNPVAAVSKSPLLRPVPNWEKPYFNENENSFNRRNAYLDFNKSVFAYLAQAKSDYLLIDVGDIRIDLVFFDKAREKCAGSFSLKRGANLLRGECLPQALETVSVLELDETWVRHCIEAYLNKILELYPQEKIILFESHAVDMFYDRDSGQIKNRQADMADSFNKAFDMVFAYCLQKLPKANVIHFPKHILGDEHHRWGRYPLHYLESFYQYGFEAVESITAAKDRDEAADRIANLHRKWERVFYMESSMLEWLDLARVDIKNHGDGNDVKVAVTVGERCNLYKAKWFSVGGAGYVLETYDKYLELELECKGAGTLQIRLMGVDRRAPGGERLPLWVDFTRLAVNKEVVFWDLKSVCHDKNYSFTREVRDGEKLKVEISLSSHGYKGEKLTKLISLWNSLKV